jgi:hypothetical protein
LPSFSSNVISIWQIEGGLRRQAPRPVRHAQRNVEAAIGNGLVRHLDDR